MIENGKTYWRSLDELADQPQFREWLHREFPENAAEMLSGASRRNVLKLMAASFGLAGLTACRRPVEKILPLTKGTEGLVPGAEMFYASAFSLGGFAAGLLVETHDGRPTKVEGNPQHPFSRGAASAFAQASVLSLYDPDRMKGVYKGAAPSSWEEFRKFAAGHFAKFKTDGGGLRILSETVNSPSLETIKAHVLKTFPGAQWVEYEPLNHDQAIAGAKLACGQALQPVYQLAAAEVVVALDCDFLHLDAPAITYTKDFAQRRRVSSEKDSMNRLYAVETHFSVTGGMADHRLRLRPSEIAEFAVDLATAVGVNTGKLPVMNASDKRDKIIAAIAKDLINNKGKAAVMAGPRQPAAVHALVYAINQALGNIGPVLTFVRPPAARETEQAVAVRNLAAEMAAGKVDTLIILGGNPMFNAPADAQFAQALGKVGTTIHLTAEPNETSKAATWALPEAHYLEAWGDVRALDGTVSIQQPMIEPLYGGRSAAEVMALVSGYPDERGFTIVHNYWTRQWSAATAEKTWRQSLHDGVVAGTAQPPVPVSVNASAVVAAVNALPKAPAQGLEVVFLPSAAVWDGRFANNGWLQECPDPITKLTWDNVAALSPATARSLGVKQGDLLLVKRGAAEVRLPALIQPGHADNAISVALGYGRQVCGRVGKGVGQNVYPLRATDAWGFAAGVSVTRTGSRYELALTQEHHSMEGRSLVREATLEHYREHPEFAHEEHFKMYQLYQSPTDFSEGYQWGMAIDLTACTGCNACVVACQAENNIPVVGKEQVIRGREMHWIRLDRYYTGDENDPELVYQPVACQQCENAPCENVCPVAATVHSPEGLNDMAYNRCIGTRYCSNNCPYKVRRFNFFNWHKHVAESQKMVFNPDVTVRMRGVMEKCTYCVQRIQNAKIQAKAQGRRQLGDGEVLTACQQTCPADAIVFGNINDPNSRVSQLKKQNRNYGLLEELQVKPRTSYLAKVRNPNPELA